MARGNLHCDARTDVGPLPRRDPRRLGGVKVEARVAVVSAAGKPRTFPKQTDAELHELQRRPALGVSVGLRAGPEAVSRKVREPVHVCSRDSGSDHDSLRTVLALEVAGHLVKLGKSGTL